EAHWPPANERQTTQVSADRRSRRATSHLGGATRGAAWSDAEAHRYALRKQPGFRLVGSLREGGVQHLLHVWQRNDVRLPCFPFIARSHTYPEMCGEVTDAEPQRLPEQLRLTTGPAVHGSHRRPYLLDRDIARSVIPAPTPRVHQQGTSGSFPPDPLCARLPIRPQGREVRAVGCGLAGRRVAACLSRRADPTGSGGAPPPPPVPGPPPPLGGLAPALGADHPSSEKRRNESGGSESVKCGCCAEVSNRQATTRQFMASTSCGGLRHGRDPRRSGTVGRTGAAE